MESKTFAEGGTEPFIIGKGEFYRDRRGSFTPLRALAGTLQCNVSVSVPHTVRGMHCQRVHPQEKLLSCLSGRIHDVCVDVRPGSPTFGKAFEFELAGGTGSQLFVPVGFAHGFEVVGAEPAMVLYMVSAPYDPADERGFHWTGVPVAWSTKREEAILSEKDEVLPPFELFAKDL